MTPWRRWRPLGSSQVAQVRDAVRPALAAWAADWFGERFRAQLSHHATDAVPSGSPAREEAAIATSRVENDDLTSQLHPVLAITASGSMPSPLATAALTAEGGVHAASATAVALLEGLQHRMLRDLHQRVARALRLEDADAQSRPTRGQQVNVHASIAGGAGHTSCLLIRIDAAALPRRLRIGPTLGGELSSRWDAVGAEPVALHVQIGRGRVAAFDVMHLKHGDVLLADRGIGAPIEVNVGDHRLGWGYPCRVGNRKAVQISFDAQEEH
jgi:flagellar motor switch/type III secretory pathway protein FliN